jgi:hypothetical protein
MNQCYNRISEEDRGDGDDPITYPLLSVAEEFNFPTKRRQIRWTNLHISILYAILTILFIFIALLWRKGSVHRDLGQLFSR